MTDEERAKKRKDYEMPMAVDFEYLNKAVQEGNRRDLTNRIAFPIFVVLFLAILSLLAIPFFIVTCCCKKGELGKC